MNNYFEKFFYWNEFVNLFDGKSIYYFGINSNETRAENILKIEELSGRCNCNNILFDYDYDKDMIVTSAGNYSLKYLKNLLDTIDKEVPLLLNITAFDLRVLGAFLFHLKKIGFSRVYCAYTEPMRYCKTKEESEKQYNKFDLYKRFRGFQAIPGFVDENINKYEEYWIAFLGFEGKRSTEIMTQYDFEEVIPVITLPSYQPGWHNFAIAENLELIKEVEHKPEYIIANSFISAYNYLEQKVSIYSNVYFRISPLGTKVNALGVLLFCLNHDNIGILYDNPILEGDISINSGKTYVFDISEVLNQ